MHLNHLPNIEFLKYKKVTNQKLNLSNTLKRCFLMDLKIFLQSRCFLKIFKMQNAKAFGLNVTGTNIRFILF